LPFKSKEGQIIWEDPTPEIVAKTRREILCPEEEEVLFPKAEEIQKSLAGAIKYARPVRNIYDTIGNLLKTDLGGADIIVPVYNSFHIVEPCIKSVLERTSWPFNLIIVDDQSDDYVKEQLEKLASDDRVTLIRNKKNRGFSASVNRGIRAGRGKYICLLNSDVIVTPMWMTKMVMALEADPRNQIVNPATNNTAIINVPLSPGASYMDMNRVFEQYSDRRYPDIMPTGFCFTFRRDLISKVGLFDESYTNYGEESDFWMRVITHLEGSTYPKYRAVMADDTYIFHERESSFSSLGKEKHQGFRGEASGRFHALWPQYNHWKKTYNVDRSLGDLREIVPTNILNERDPLYRICWVVYSTAFCGGMKYIADIVNEINERGGDARVALIKRDKDRPVETMGDLRTGPIVFENEEDFVTTFNQRVFGNGILVAATVETAPLVANLCARFKKLHSLMHVQSYEPDLIEEEAGKKELKEAYSYIPEIISNSKWITNTLKTELNLKPFATISPGVDTRLFYPRDRSKGDERLTVMIPLINSYPFKGYNRGVQLVQQLWNQSVDRGMDLRIMVYGSYNIPESYGTVVALGEVPQPRLAHLLGTEVDVFVDPAHVHSYGMPCLEAMASGVPVVTWDNKGIREYVKDGQNGILVPNGLDTVNMAAKILDVLANTKKRHQLSRRGLRVVEKHDRQKSVDKVIHTIETHMGYKVTQRRIVVVTPHLRKHGGPTTILNLANLLSARGHHVSVTSIYKDINPEVTDYTELPIDFDYNNIPECDILISNSDNPMNDLFTNLPQAKKKIMLKLSHNPRFQQLENDSLKLKWDKIITSTNWLVDVCKKPLEGWDHPSVEAERVGWYHYGHELFDTPPSSREYGEGTKQIPIKIATLIHQHPSKGTPEAITALRNLKAKYGPNIHIIGVGQIPKRAIRSKMGDSYVESPTRDQMAALLKEVDIWVSASHT
jgi:GT2 family glycosyltransferase/glycosyltransferase involved in cell wall biosynthesis